MTTRSWTASRNEPMVQGYRPSVDSLHLNMAKPRIYTRAGDDGTTGLYFGGRLPKDDPQVEAYGVIDEAQAFLGAARALAARGSELDGVLVALERDLWTVMAELATDAANRHKLGDDGVISPTRV